MRNRLSKPLNRRKSTLYSGAFTIIELVIVIAIIGILATVIVVSYNGWKKSTISAQIKSDLNGVASAMENYRNFNNKYPESVPSSFSPSSGVTLTGGSSDGGLTYCVSAASSSYAGISFYIDSANSSAGAQAGTCPSQYSLTLTAGTGGAVNSSASGNYISGATVTITATPSLYYQFSSWTGDGCSGDESHAITITTNMTCTANFTPISIATPSTPVVSASTDGSTTTWSWGAASCSSNSARYQYKYTISPSGYDSGWVTTGSTSVAFTTSTGGQTYAVEVQAQCYNTATSSSWSGTGSASYYRPITYTLTVSCPGLTTCSGGGTYTQNTYATATTANNTASGYYFNYWSGDCAGGDYRNTSVSVYMNGNKTCTTNNNIASHWISGVYGTNLYGKFVYYQDDPTQRRFKTTDTADTSTYSYTGVDPTHPTYSILKNPLNYSLDWSIYPAQNTCNGYVNPYGSVGGGRTPDQDELANMFNLQSYFGGNFNQSEGYRSSAQSPFDSTQTHNRMASTNTQSVSDKTRANPTRCVYGSY